MRLAMQCVLMAQCLLVGLAGGQAQAGDGILNAIPGDAIGFAVVHNLADASGRVDEVAKLVHAPMLHLFNLAKRVVGLEKGVDEQGDMALVLMSIDPGPKSVLLVPVANSADFFAALKVTEPATGMVDVQLVGKPMLVARKGSYAAIADAADRDVLEQVVSATTNLATDTSLAAWLDANKASVVVTSGGIKQLAPKLTAGIRAIQGQIRQMGGEQGQTGADALEMYVQLFSAAEREVAQFGIGLRIDSAQTIDLVKRIEFTPDGAWAKWAADVKPATENFLAGLPAEPFIVAMGGVVPPGSMEPLMKYSVRMMQEMPMYKLTPEQAEKYAMLSMNAMSGLTSLQMVIGVSEPGAGFYGNTTAVFTCEDSQRLIEGYEKTLAALREFAGEVKNSALPVATCQHVKLGETDVLEVSMDLAHLNQLAQPGGPDPQKMMQLMMGPGGQMKIYLAAVDGHTIVMCYTSLERLQSAIDFYKSNERGLAGDADVVKVAAMLPEGSQFVGYVSLGGMANVVRQFTAAMPGAPAAAIPDFPDSPPLGMAAKVTPTGAEGHLIVTAETLRAIGDVVAKARGAAPAGSAPQ
jgi:hypothetical protein